MTTRGTAATWVALAAGLGLTVAGVTGLASGSFAEVSAARDVGTVPAAGPPAASAGLAAGGSVRPPEAATPQAAKPKPAKPKVAKPKAAKPKPAKPKPAKPKAAKPKPALPEELRIPRLDVSAPVEVVAVDPDGALGVPEDPDVLGWWNAGARPGSGRGSVVIDGHVDSARYGRGMFSSLYDVREGDRVEVVDAKGRVLRYEITGRRSYSKTALPAEIFAQDVAERLVLITCGGEFDRDRGHYEDNVVVYAVPA